MQQSPTAAALLPRALTLAVHGAGHEVLGFLVQLPTASMTTAERRSREAQFFHTPTSKSLSGACLPETRSNEKL